MVMRNLAAAAKPVTEIKQEGDEYIITTTTTFKTTEIKFKLGEEFEEETADGRKCKVATFIYQPAYLLEFFRNQNAVCFI